MLQPQGRVRPQEAEAGPVHVLQELGLAPEQHVVDEPLEPSVELPGPFEALRRALEQLEPGVTELHIQPAIDTPEVRAFSAVAEQWIDDLAFATDGSLAAAIEAAGAVSIGYRDLRAVMRAG